MAYTFNPFTANLDYYQTGSGGTPGGSTTQVQYNNAGAFGGITGATSNGTTLTITSGRATTDFSPTTNDGASLGTTSLQFSDIFLAEGGVVNWDNGDVTITQTGNDLSFAGANTYRFDGIISTTNAISLEETGAGTDVIAIQAPASIAAGYTLTLPVDDGNSGQVLRTDGSGVLSWITPTTGTVTGTGANTYVTYWNGTNTITGSADFEWIQANKQLQIASNGVLAFPGNGNVQADDQLTFLVGDTGGSAKFVLDGSNNTSYNDLTISNGASSKLYLSAPDGVPAMGGPGIGFTDSLPNGGAIYFNTDGEDGFYFKQTAGNVNMEKSLSVTGNVGVGGGAIDDGLNVATGGLHVSSTAAVDHPSEFFLDMYAGYVARIIAIGDSVTTGVFDVELHGGSGPAAIPLLWGMDSGDNLTGFLGINTESPTQALDVLGSIQASGNFIGAPDTSYITIDNIFNTAGGSGLLTVNSGGDVLVSAGSGNVNIEASAGNTIMKAGGGMQFEILDSGDIAFNMTGSNIIYSGVGGLQLNTTNILDVADSAGNFGDVLTSTGGSGDSWVSKTALKIATPLFDHFADVNNSTTTETDLYTDTLAAGQLGSNGAKVVANYQLVCTGAALASQDMRIYFGGTKIYDSGALSIGAITSNFSFNVVVIRESSSVVRCETAVSSDFATLFPYSAYTRVTGLTLSNTQILKITGQASGAGGASNQITSKLGYINFIPAA